MHMHACMLNKGIRWKDLVNAWGGEGNEQREGIWCDSLLHLSSMSLGKLQSLSHKKWGRRRGKDRKKTKGIDLNQQLLGPFLAQ